LPSPSHAGTVIVIGGALKADSDAVWQRVVDEAGGAGAAIAVFPTAAYEPERIGAQITTALNRCGARAEVIPVAPNLEGVDLQAMLNDPALIARVAAARAVFFSGGAQEFIVDTLQPGGRPTAMLEAIRAVFAAGGVVAGTSAGAAVMSRLMFRDAMDNLAVLKGLWRAGQEYDHGLGFVDGSLLVDQHFLKRGRIGRLLPAMQALGCRLGLGVDENAAVVIKGTALEVIGGSGAVLVDLGDATHDARLPAFNLRGARLSYLDHGDRHDLTSGMTTPAERKRAEARIDPAAGGFEPGTPSQQRFPQTPGCSPTATSSTSWATAASSAPWPSCSTAPPTRCVAWPTGPTRRPATPCRTSASSSACTAAPASSAGAAPPWAARTTRCSARDWTWCRCAWPTRCSRRWPPRADGGRIASRARAPPAA
jgi:cyanophycinase